MGHSYKGSAVSNPARFIPVLVLSKGAGVGQLNWTWNGANPFQWGFSTSLSPTGPFDPFTGTSGSDRTITVGQNGFYIVQGFDSGNHPITPISNVVDVEDN